LFMNKYLLCPVMYGYNVIYYNSDYPMEVEYVRP